MEHHAQSVDDALIGGLSYKLMAGASYVTNRRSASYFAPGGNSYSPNGIKVMKFNLTGDQRLDPDTFRVAFQLNNNNGNGNMVQPLSWNPAVFFRRARLICGGQVVEDIDDFNRLSMMLTDLLPEDDQPGKKSDVDHCPQSPHIEYDENSIWVWLKVIISYMIIQS